MYISGIIIRGFLRDGDGSMESGRRLVNARSTLNPSAEVSQVVGALAHAGATAVPMLLELRCAHIGA